MSGFFLPHCLLLCLLHWLFLFFYLVGLFQTLFLDLSSFYSRIFDDSFQPHGFQLHLYAIDSQSYISSPGLSLKLQTYFQLPT